MIRSLLSVLLLTFGLQAQSQDDFQRFFTSFDTLSAEFSQRIIEDDQQIGQTTLGTLIFQRPQQLVWHTSTPIEQTLLLKDTQTWLIDYELEQVSLGELLSVADTPLYWLSTPYKQLQDQPQYSHSNQEVDWYSSGVTAQPNFGFKHGVLHLISLTNALGQNIWLELSDVKTNLELDQQQFVVKIPPDFDVIKSF